MLGPLIFICSAVGAILQLLLGLTFTRSALRRFACLAAFKRHQLRFLLASIVFLVAGLALSEVRAARETRADSRASALEAELRLRDAASILETQAVRFPDEEAKRLAAGIPDNANAYFLALRAVVERKFPHALVLLQQAEQSRPVALPRIFATRARVYAAMGQPLHAVTWFERALAEDPGDLRLYIERAHALVSAGRYVDALTLGQATSSLIARTTLGDRGLLRDALRASAKAAVSLARFTSADSTYRALIDIGTSLGEAGLPSLASDLDDFGNMQLLAGHLHTADSLFRVAYDIRRSYYAGPHPDLAQSLNNLGGAAYYGGDVAAAGAMLKQALKMRQQLLGTRHPDIGEAYNNLGVYYAAVGAADSSAYQLSAAAYDTALRTWAAVVGPEHPNVAVTLNNQAELYFARGDFAKSKASAEHALAINLPTLGPDHPNTAYSRSHLAAAMLRLGDVRGAEREFREVLRARLKSLGPLHPDVGTAENNLGVVMAESCRFNEAVTHYANATRIRVAAYGETHYLTKQSDGHLRRAQLAVRGKGAACTTAAKG